MAELKSQGTQTQNFPVNEKERDLLIATFKGNEHLLKALRSLFFGFDLSQKESLIIKNTFKNGELVEAVRKKIYPRMSADSPIGQVADFWMGAETQVFGAQEGAIYQAIYSKQAVKELFERAISLLSNPDGRKIDIDFTPPQNPKKSDLHDISIKLMSRNLYIKTIETGLLFIQLAAEAVADTPLEQTKKKLMNSSK